MSKKRMVFPMEVPHGSVTAKIYRVRNKSYRVTTRDGQVKEKERFSFFVPHFSVGKRTQKMFAEFK